MVIAEQYHLNLDTQLDAGIPNGSMLIYEIISLPRQCGPKFANTSSNCPTDLLSQYESDRDTASAPGSNHEIILLWPLLDIWMKPESPFLSSIV